MKAYAIAKYIAPPRTTAFHDCMFHGDTDPVLAIGHRLGQDLSETLRLRRNGLIVPDVFEPATSLVVSSPVQARLASLPNIALVQVAFTKLIAYPYQAGDSSYYQTKAFRSDPVKYDPEKLITRLPDEPELHRKIGEYYELVTARLSDIEGAYSALRTIKCHFRLTTVHPNLELPLSDQLLTDYPIVWQFKNIFSEKAFDLIGPYVNRDYFEVVEFTV